MRLRTLLNRVYKLPGFVYGRIRLLENRRGPARLLVEVRPRGGSRDRCAGCGQAAPGYDPLQPRLFQFVPILGLPLPLGAQRRPDTSDRAGSSPCLEEHAGQSQIMGWLAPTREH